MTLYNIYILYHSTLTPNQKGVVLMASSNNFRIIEKHSQDSPTLQQINGTLGDWFQKLLVTKEYQKEVPSSNEESA